MNAINWTIGETFDNGSGEEAHVYVNGTPWMWAVRAGQGRWCVMPTESAPAPWYTAIVDAAWGATIADCIASVERLVADAPTTAEGIAMEHERTLHMIANVRL